MSQITELATGQVSTSDELRVELIQPAELPPRIIFRWPAQPTRVGPSQFTAAANSVARIMAVAVTRLAELRRDKKL
jgi:hypothetical protein